MACGTMFRLRKAAFLLTSCFSGALVAQPLVAQTPVDIVRIWQNFVVSRVAAEACKKVDDRANIQFQKNLLDVRIRAAQALQERNPSKSLDEIAVQMTSAEGIIGNRVAETIKRSGCSTPETEQLIALYEMHSNMKL